VSEVHVVRFVFSYPVEKSNPAQVSDVNKNKARRNKPGHVFPSAAKRENKCHEQDHDVNPVAAFEEVYNIIATIEDTNGWPGRTIS